MKYTAFATMFIGLVIAGFAGLQYGSAGPAETSSNPAGARTGMPFAVGIAFIVLGAGILIFGGRGFIYTWIRSRRRPAGASENLARQGEVGSSDGRAT